MEVTRQVSPRALRYRNVTVHKLTFDIIVVVAFAFLIGLQICNIFTTPLSSGIDTIFVATAWEPSALMQNHPELYDAMVRVYPQVQQAIHA